MPEKQAQNASVRRIRMRRKTVDNSFTLLAVKGS
jgi:hypothetical protein